MKLNEHISKLESKGATGRVATIKKQIQRFNNICTRPIKIQDVLLQNEVKLLKLLETRSHPNNGDTKVYNQDLQKFLKVSKATIERYLKKLEDYGLIARLTIKRFVHKRGHPLSERIIRCRRILLRSRMQVKDREELKWKTDFRPEFNLTDCYDEYTGQRVSHKWYLNYGQTAKDMYGNVYKMGWEMVHELEQMNLYGGYKVSIETTLGKLMNMKQIDPKNVTANLIMGKRFATEYDY